MTTQQERTRTALEILAKWRTLLTGWQVGTRPKGDPEGDAIRDHRELTLVLRAEVSALAGLLMRKGCITADEWLAALEQEAKQLSADLEARFPGVKAHEQGLDINVARAMPWMRRWKP
jgi:hypothetical protein